MLPLRCGAGKKSAGPGEKFLGACKWYSRTRNSWSGVCHQQDEECKHASHHSQCGSAEGFRPPAGAARGGEPIALRTARKKRQITGTGASNGGRLPTLPGADARSRSTEVQADRRRKNNCSRPVVSRSIRRRPGSRPQHAATRTRKADRKRQNPSSSTGRRRPEPRETSHVGSRRYIPIHCRVAAPREALLRLGHENSR